MRTHFIIQKFQRPMRLSLIALASVAAVGCASVQPVAMAPKDMASQIQKDGELIRKDVAPIAGPVTLDDAMARALKYNLDRRARMMEEALAMGQLDVSKFDMLPKIVAQAGYSTRDRSRFTYSSLYSSEEPGTSASTSAARNHSTFDLGLTWSLLDVGLGHYGAKQQADRFLIAGENAAKPCTY